MIENIKDFWNQNQDWLSGLIIALSVTLLAHISGG